MTGIQTRVHIRWMIRRDMPEVLDIEGSSFRYPWTEEVFLAELRQGHVIGQVAEYGDRIVGYCVYALHRSTIDVYTFAVHPGFLRQQIGQQIIRKLKGKLSAQRRNRLVFFVRESNLVGQCFLRSQGFLALLTMQEFYQDSGEDAYVMEFELDSMEE
jgi:ribosomal-protein-alanine N-acetyltransferase